MKFKHTHRDLPNGIEVTSTVDGSATTVISPDAASPNDRFSLTWREAAIKAGAKRNEVALRQAIFSDVAANLSQLHKEQKTDANRGLVKRAILAVTSALGIMPKRQKINGMDLSLGTDVDNGQG